MKKYIPIICILLFIISASSAIADHEAGPYTYTEMSPNGNYVFVMLAPYHADFKCGEYLYDKDEQEKICKIREKYHTSGLYRIDDPSKPLWTVDWYTFNVEVASDGEHLIRNGPWARTAEPSHEAVSFFRNGKLITTYDIDDLVDFPKLMPHSVSHFMWCSESFLKDQSKTYFIKTLQGEMYEFDITTGEITSSFRTPRWIVTFLIIITALFIYRKARGKRKDGSYQQVNPSRNKKWLRVISLLFLAGSILALIVSALIIRDGAVRNIQELIEFFLIFVSGLMISVGVWKLSPWGWKLTILFIPVFIAYIIFELIRLKVWAFEPYFGIQAALFALINALILRFLHRSDVKEHFSLSLTKWKNLRWTSGAAFAMGAFLLVFSIVDTITEGIVGLAFFAALGWLGRVNCRSERSVS